VDVRLFRELVALGIREHALIPASGEVVCLVSGGPDSTCLFHVLRELGFRVSALHVDHGLRGRDSDADARFCRDRLGAEVVDGRGGRTEDELRRIRYSFATDRLRATGHTASDQVETVLYRLAASPGRRALLGMAPREGRLIRPLLGVSRDETAAHCEARGLEWREDASNAAFARGRIRHELLPALRAIHPAADANILRTLELLRDEAAVLDDVVDAALRDAGDPPRVDALRALPPALGRLAVQRLAGRTPVGHRIDEILALHEGGALDVGDGLRAEIRGGALRFGRSEGRAAPRRAPS
jgi:tRNA(Ile)-lysidine synthase